MIFDSKISAIEEREDLDTMIVDVLHGTLTAYEMRIEQEDPSRKKQPSKPPTRGQASQGQNQSIVIMMNLTVRKKPTL